jgi:hypothetical protein
MTQETSTPGSALRRLGLALVAALILLITIVLPAEYGRDPTGIGKLLGLTAMQAKAEPAALPAQTVQLSNVAGGNDQLTSLPVGDGRDPVPLPNPKVHQLQAQAPRTDTLTIKLGVDEKTEIKAQLAEGKMMVYSWSVAGGNAYVDFHGHSPALGERFWVRYLEADGISGSNGSLVAPFAGEHGWYWLNVSEQPITITLKVTGYQDKLINYGLLK